jgi:hypothetical protein
MRAAVYETMPGEYNVSKADPPVVVKTVFVVLRQNDPS